MTTTSLLILVLAASAQPELPEAGSSTTGYASPDKAIEALRADPAVSETEQGGWRIFQDPAHHAIWSFPPAQHPAYPSAVKREFVERDGAVHVQMGVQCGASKSACDQLVREFQALNQKMSEAIQADKAGHSK